MATRPVQLEALTLGSFKSFTDELLPIDDFTLLVGRNSSGKSNALDGLWVLASLSSGGDLREALDGGRQGSVVRGGVLGCPPLGKTEFTLGCAVRASEGHLLNYEVSVATDPVIQVVFERLWTKRLAGNKRGEDRDLLRTDIADPNRSDIVARWDNQKRGTNPPVDFRASQLLLTQVATRVPATSAAGREVHDSASQVIAALQSVFVLDPVPNEMRQYVRRKDSVLRRSADNLSAALAGILRDPTTRDRVLELVSALSESDVAEIRIAESDLDDVMLTLMERMGGHIWPVPARQVSDGTLRFLALVAALLQSPPESSSVLLDDPGPVGQTTLVVEELENGLHPSQADRIIELLRTEASRRNVRVLATSHSPAILDALPGDVHNSVIVSFRDESGSSRLRRLPELDSYLPIATSGSLGDAATTDSLRALRGQPMDPRAALEQLFSAS